MNASNPGGGISKCLPAQPCVMRKRTWLANPRGLLAAGATFHLQPFTGVAFRVNRRAQAFLC